MRMISFCFTLISLCTTSVLSEGMNRYKHLSVAMFHSIPVDIQVLSKRTNINAGKRSAGVRLVSPAAVKQQQTVSFLG